MATPVRSEPGELAAILTQTRHLAPDGRDEVVTDFARMALRRVPADQLAEADPAQTARQLVDAFHTVDGRSSGELAIRVFTPDVALDGWSEPGTVVQVASVDRPFLLSTVTEELENRGLQIVRSLHPILGVERADDRRLTAILPARTADSRESLLHLELDAELSHDEAVDLRRTLNELLHDVLAATDDYRPMRQRVSALAEQLRDDPPSGIDSDESVEAAELLDWLLDDNLVLLGWREYRIRDRAGDPVVEVVDGSGLGILRDESSSAFHEPVPLRDLPTEMRRRLQDPRVLTISKTNRLSTVHRRARMDYIGISRYDDDGNVIGEDRLLGLFTRKAYSEPAASTPVLRRKLDTILEREDVVEGSHDEMMLVSLFQAIPKDELFQTPIDELQETIVGLLSAEERGETRVMLRLERFTRTISVLLAVPKDRYSPDLRRRIQDLLRDRFEANRIDVDLSLGDRTDAIARFTVHVSEHVPEVDGRELKREIRRLARSWVDEVVAMLTRQRGESEAQRLTHRYIDRLPRAYRDITPAEQAPADLDLLDDTVTGDVGLRVILQEPRPDSELVRLKLAVRDQPLVLSEVLPILENLGLVVVEELPFGLEGPGPAVWVHDFGVRDARGQPIDVEGDAQRIAETVVAGWDGRCEVDTLNRLVTAADLTWQQVSVLRAYRRLRRQIGTAYTPSYVNDTLAMNPDVARGLVELFEARFDPARGDDGWEQARSRVQESLEDVERLDHDRILGGFLASILATLRTNAFRDDAVAEDDAGTPIPYLSFKLDSSKIPAMPPPVPYREIFVYSPLMEGVHLRGGPVARGGLRWSDRQDDVRTEVLGLMKAQMLKNAVIVPTGAKGGFVLRSPPEDPDRLREAVRTQYSTFVRGLLDVTDDLVAGEVVPPRDVVRHDGDDPYLVVAADRGTATFSDLANDVAESYGFWLGDAFASGGSHGYDHKQLGITARGAWVAVTRHFRELGVDPQTDPVRVVGIGDMSGDVFGNGMLQSRSIKLVAAFDHRDVFIDPDPDPEASFEERQRLFGLPDSTWRDFQRRVISAGGGVFSRTAKSIELTDEIRETLRIDDERLSPPELIRAILRAPVDLLFAGGIGTYVKASTETNEEIGDRANDDVRIDATDLRARVFGEGANLAITQRGRIQYARRGGRINQDAIDNAGGVDTSDREVNLKILLRLAMEEERIDRSERDDLLARVTDDVVAAVLRDVDLQAWILSQEAARSPERMDAYEQVMQDLEDRDILDREVAVLPTSAEMAERAELGAGLTRPELATLLAAAKSLLASDLLDTGLPDQDAVQSVLCDYFPSLFVKRFKELLPRHRLRAELIATEVANDLVDRMGITFAFRLATETGGDAGRIAGAYWAAREVAGADRRWRGVEDLRGTLAPERVLELKEKIDDLVAQLTRTYLEDPEMDDVARIIDRDGPVFATLADHVMELGTSAQRSRRTSRAQALIDDLVDEDLAVYLAGTRELAMACDVAMVLRSLTSDRTAEAVGDAFLRLGEQTGLERLEQLLGRTEDEGRWERWQRSGLNTDLRRLRRRAVAAALREEPDLAEPEAVKRFLQRRREEVGHTLDLIRRTEADEEVPLHAVAVAARVLRDALERRP